jgi:hypothetical protein
MRNMCAESRSSLPRIIKVILAGKTIATNNGAGVNHLEG